MKLPPFSPLRQKRLRTAGFYWGLGFCLAVCACVLAGTVMTSMGCSNISKDDVAKRYVDQTPAALGQLNQQNIDMNKLLQQGAQISEANTDARGFLASALNNFADFWSVYPPAATRPAPIVSAEKNVKAADGKLADQVNTLTAAKATADGVIKSQQETIKTLGDQVKENAELKADGLAKAQTIAEDQAALKKWEDQDKDFFGTARRWWKAFKLICIIAIPVLLLLGYLGTRYGADSLIKPVADGVGAAEGALVNAGRWTIGKASAGILSLFGPIGHMIDEHAANVKALAQKAAATSSTAAAGRPAQTPVITVVTAAPLPVSNP